MKENALLTITEAAIKHIEKSMADDGNATDFRLSVKRTGCNGWMYMPSLVTEPKENDVVVECGAPFNIYLDATHIDLVRGTQIDVVKKDLGLNIMVFNNPNASGECGCGESFNVD